VHPVETGLAFAVMKGVVGGKQDEIAFFPENEVPEGIGSAHVSTAWKYR
jgi:hypothetical protein